MKWWESYDNVVKLLLIGAALVLVFTGREDMGFVFLAISGISIGAGVMDKKRIAKKNGNGPVAALLMCGLLGLMFTGCISVTLPSEFIDLTEDVYDRHDGLVKEADFTLIEQQDCLRDTAILREFLKEMAPQTEGD